MSGLRVFLRVGNFLKLCNCLFRRNINSVLSCLKPHLCILVIVERQQGIPLIAWTGF